MVSFILVPELKNLDVTPAKDEKLAETKDVKLKVLSKSVEEEKLTLMALDGFLLVLSDEGEITYVSDNISDILGLSKVSLILRA